MNAPIRDACDCSSRKPMRRRFVSKFPGALLSLSQEKSSGVEIACVASENQALARTCEIILKKKKPILTTIGFNEMTFKTLCEVEFQKRYFS